MKKIQGFRILFFSLLCLSVAHNVYSRGSNQDKSKDVPSSVKAEIISSLSKWNEAANSRNVRQFMDLYDSGTDIMLVGSDSGEVFKGRDEIETWITNLFSFASFSWDMKRIDIDHNGNTAWVFMDGFMIVTNDRGKTNKFPYRFTGILVKSKKSWKWRFFNGSVPRGH